jgi:rhamnosyltransferase
MLVFFSVLYNPEINALINIRKAKSLGILPIVYLNKVENHFLNELSEIGVVVLGDNINVGLGQAFHELEQYLNSGGYKYFVYFDQDTAINQTAWLTILETYEITFKTKSIGLLFYGHNSNPHSKAVTSSGSLFSLRILNEIGFHDNSYFVEGVDYEFCLRLSFYGYKIQNMKCLGVDHQSLQDVFIIKLFFKMFILRVYGKSRTKDFNLSHKRLLKRAFEYRDFSFSIFFLKSIIKHNIMELVSRTFIKYK